MFKGSKIKKITPLIIIIGLLFSQPLNLKALSSSEAKQIWIQSKEVSRIAQQEHVQANIDWASNKTSENNLRVIDTGKYALHAALNEAEAWLIWVNLEVKENPEVPNDLKQTIEQDVNSNIAKINDLRAEVDEVDNRLELGIVFLKMVGKYLELVTNVAKNTGLVWVHTANTYADIIEEYEVEIREAGVNAQNKDEIIAQLDKTVQEISKARSNINLAETEYLQVTIPGNPILRFSNGNQYLRLARNNLLSAHSYLKQAYRLLVGSD
ncbi:hypothetical protein JW865_07020 [Candidatus Bathyarchaeota archaeon]|nr:hypothetical protein [Candidatus Bathyarchaeota archaeon]